MRESHIPLADEARWRQALAGVPHDFGHTWEYCHALTRTAEAPTFLYCFDDGHTRVVCPYRVRTFRGYADIVTPPGFSGFVGTGPCPEFPTYWRASAAEQGYVCGYVALNPVLDDTTYSTPGDVDEYNAVYVLNIERDLDTLFDGLHRNRRRELRDWTAASASIIYDRDALTAFLMNSYATFLRERGASTAYQRSDATLAYLCGLDNVYVVGTGGSRGPTSVYVFGYTATVATCLFHVALPEAREHAPALVWAGILHLKDRGVKTLNLGGGIKEGDSIAAAKQRFGARRQPLKALCEVYRPVAFDALCASVSPLPDGTPAFFPAYRAVDRSTSVTF